MSSHAAEAPRDGLEVIAEADRRSLAPRPRAPSARGAARARRAHALDGAGARRGQAEPLADRGVRLGFRGPIDAVAQQDDLALRLGISSSTRPGAVSAGRLMFQLLSDLRSRGESGSPARQSIVVPRAAPTGRSRLVTTLVACLISATWAPADARQRSRCPRRQGDAPTRPADSRCTRAMPALVLHDVSRKGGLPRLDDPAHAGSIHKMHGVAFVWNQSPLAPVELSP